MQTLFDAIAADDFWKQCGQRWNCSWWAISLLATRFSTLFTNTPSFTEIFRFLSLCFRSHLQRNRCMWERVKWHILNQGCLLFSCCFGIFPIILKQYIIIYNNFYLPRCYNKTDSLNLLLLYVTLITRCLPQLAKIIYYIINYHNTNK